MKPTSSLRIITDTVAGASVWTPIVKCKQPNEISKTSAVKDYDFKSAAAKQRHIHKYAVKICQQQTNCTEHTSKTFS